MTEENNRLEEQVTSNTPSLSNTPDNSTPSNTPTHPYGSLVITPEQLVEALKKLDNQR